MRTTITTADTLPTLDETLVPITVGRRAATPQETRAINALAAVLDDQPGPPKTLFEFTAGAHELRSPRPAVNRVRVKAQAYRANERAAENMIPALMVDVRVMDNTIHADDYTPAFVAPAFEHMTTTVVEADVVSTRDEALAVASEVQARVDIHGDAKDVEKAVTEVMMADMMPFGQATLRLFCC